MKTITCITAALLVLITAVNGQTDLDAIIRASKPGETIKLEAGIYTTAGVNESGGPNAGAKLPKGVNLRGKGAGRTTIIATNQENRSLNVLWGLGDNTIEDLTVDTGIPERFNRQYKFNGIYIQPGTKPNVVKGVTVINVYGNKYTRSEGFGIIIEGNYSSINDCIVTQPRGDYVQAYSINGLKPIVQNCSAIFPTDTIESGGLTCYGIGSVTNALFINNLASGGSAGFYWDTGTIQGLTIENCTIMDSPVGVYIKNQFQSNVLQVVNGVTIRGNKIYLPFVTSHQVAIALNNSRLDNQSYGHDAGCIDNVLIDGNFFGYKPGGYVPQVPSNLRKAISLTTQVYNPKPGVCGINGVTIKGNTYQKIPNDLTPWVHRNKWNLAKSVTWGDTESFTILDN